MPETDQDRIANELRRFEEQVAKRFMQALTQGIQQRETGWVRLIVKLKDGRIIGRTNQIDFNMDLDANGAD